MARKARYARSERNQSDGQLCAPLEWPDNLDISDAHPSEYVPILRERFIEDAEWKAMCTAHALPDVWEKMNYKDFLIERGA